MECGTLNEHRFVSWWSQPEARDVNALSGNSSDLMDIFFHPSQRFQNALKKQGARI
jgi:hypothetical protein